jgi:chromosome segregation ATPase
MSESISALQLAQVPQLTLQTQQLTQEDAGLRAQIDEQWTMWHDQQVQIYSLQSQVSSLERDMVDLQERVSALETQNSDLEGNVSELQQQIDDYIARLEELEWAVQGLESRVEDLEMKLYLLKG